MLRQIVFLVGLLSSFGSFAGLISAIELDETALEKQYLALKNNPKLKRITNLLANGEYQEAKSRALAQVQESPQDYGAHLLAVLSYAALDEHQGLQKHLSIVASSNPHFELPLRESVFNVYIASKRYFLALNIVSGYQHFQLSENTLLAMAKIYNGQTKYQLAKSALEAVIAKEPSNQLAKFELALTYFVTRDFTAAEMLLSKLIDNGKTDLKTLQLAASTAVSLDKLTSAVTHYESILDKAPEDVLANLNLAIIRLINGEPKRAESYLQKVLEKDELSEDAWVAMFIVQSEMDYRGGSLSSAPATLNQQPLFAFARLLETGERSFLSDAAKLFPDLRYSDLASLSKAQKLNTLFKGLLYQTGYYQYAISDNHDRADNNSSLAQLVVGRSLIKTDRIDEAREVYADILTEKNTLGWISATIELAELDYSDQRFESAKTAYQKLLAFDNKRVDWLFQLSSIYLSLENYEQAINTLVQASGLTSHPYVTNQLAAIYSEFINNQPKAISLASQALNDYADLPTLLDTLAWAYYQNEEFTKASKVYIELLGASGSNLPPETFYRIGLVFEKAKVSGAAELFELALNAGADFEGETHAKQYLLNDVG